jgi:hypothetical protein
MTGSWSSVSAPPELAVVISFQATTQPGIPQARRRNRIYMGPLGFIATGGLIPNTQRDAFKDAAQQFLIDANGWANWGWVVYSPTAQTIAQVNNGWVDNAYDIQRRRGLLSTERVVFD